MDYQNAINTIKTVADVSNYILFCIPIVLLIVSVLLWLKFGKNEKIEVYARSHPPTNCSVLDADLLYNKNASCKSMASLIIPLAAEGCVEIFNENRNNNFLIKKIKDYDGDNVEEACLMSDLFPCETSEVSETTLMLRSRMLGNRRMKPRIVRKANYTKNKERFFELFPAFPKYIIMISYIISFFVMNLPFCTDSLEPGVTIMMAPFSAAGFFCIVSCFIGKNMVFEKIASVILGSSFIGVSSFMLIMASSSFKPIFWVCQIIDVFCAIGILICFLRLPRKTKYGNEVFSHLEGLEQFIRTAKEDEIDKLLAIDPNYFFEILPYAYVLNLSQEWLDKFKSMDVVPPKWYHCQGCNNSYMYLKSIITFVRVFQSSITPIEPDSGD